MSCPSFFPITKSGYFPPGRLANSAALCSGAQVIALLNDIKDEEQDAYDNLPESLQASANASKMTDAIDTIDDAISSVEEAQRHIEEAVA